MSNFNTHKTYTIKNKIKKSNINEFEQNIVTEETGFIKISVYDSVTNQPIENTKIEIIDMRISGLYHERGYGNIIATEMSDSNGQVPLIQLMSNYEPEDIIFPEHEHIYYHMRVTNDNYHMLYVTNIIIFPGITNIYRINLYPITLERPQYEFIITPVMPL